MNVLLKSGYALCIAGIICLLLPARSGPQDTPKVPLGSTQTLLPDGRWLLLGGEGADGVPVARAFIYESDSSIQSSKSEIGNLSNARAWHSATILPDGTFLIFGGIGINGEVLSDAELFDPETQTFEPISTLGLTPRARHTATLLTDGHLLVAGGLATNGRARNDAALWNFEDQSLVSLSDKLSDGRYDHTATLLADGRVLLSGGFDRNGNALNNGDLFDPSTGRFITVSASDIQNLESKIRNLELAASLPTDGSVGVSLDSLMAVRFSKPMRVETVNSDTVILSGPDGIEQVKVVPAEGGMLGFITPQSELLPESTYTVTLNGLADRDGFFLPASAFSFMTESSDNSPLPGDPPSSPPPPEDPKPGENNPQDDDGWEWRGELRDGKPHSPWQDLPPLQANAGVTALAGQALDLKGEPLANVVLEIEYESKKARTRTDESGQFLLQHIQAGSFEFFIDGRRAHNPKSKVGNPKWGYGTFEYRLEIVDDQTNVLPFTIWLPKIDANHTVGFSSPTSSEVIATTPRFPGFEVHISPNTVIYDHEGKRVTEITITRVPMDRPPFPLPAGMDFPAYATIQPGGAYLYGPVGAHIVYPNKANSPSGARFNLWHYDPDDQGWYVYGQGTVTEDGTQIVADPGASFYSFTGAGVGFPNYNAPSVWPPPGGIADGDPVDLRSGLFVLQKTDIFLPDILPVDLTRTYRPGDTTSRPFGIGATHPYEIFLKGDGLHFAFVELILPDGGRIHYDRISPGGGYLDAIFEHVLTPTRFYKSKISWNGGGWDLKLKDGTVYVFGPGLGSLLAIRDRNGNQVTITRTGAESGNITKISSPTGRFLVFTYNANRITQVTDNIGRTVNYTYDTSGRLSTVTDPNGGITQYTYDTSHRMLTLKDARGIVFLTNQYDANGRVISQTQADNTTFQFAYTLDANGKVTQNDVTDPRGNIRRVTFNSDGYSLTDTRAVGTPEAQATSYVRQAGTNLPLSVTDALNRKTSYAYDSMGNVISVTRLADTPDAVTTTFTYEPTFNQLATVTDALNHTTTLNYDTTGNLTNATNPLNQMTTLTYNAAGLPISVSDPLNNTTQFTYDLSDLTAVTDPLGNTATRFRDSVGRLLSARSPLEYLTLYDHDALNRLTKVTDTLGAQTQFGYDPNGNLLSVTDAKNQTTSYTYNTMDRLATRTDPLLHVETYNAYDNNGNLTQFTDRKSQITNYTYDALNRRTAITYADLSSTTYTYDAGNRLTQVVDSISGTIVRTYDGLDRLASETTPQGSVSYTYDAAGRRATMSVPGQATINYTYNNANRLTQITQGSSVVAFGYDAAGRRISLTLPNGILVEYGYDFASRITNITYKQGTTLLGDLTYEYDKSGNRTKVGGTWGRTGIPEAVSSTNYNAANHQLTFDDKTLTYDNNGNLTSILDGNGTTLYTWNARNQLTGVTSPGVSGNFVDDGLGRREKKTINGFLAEFLFDGLNPVQETSGATVLANTLTGLGIDDFLTRTDVSTGMTSSFLTNELGSAVALTDAAGTIETEYTYEAFGRTSITGVSNNNPFQYTGRESDSTGLYYYRNRYYNPSLQRFISEDPIGFASGVNFYTYADNNPITYSDPLGLCSDPGGPGIRYCMNRYIHDETSFFVFRGNDRAPEGAGGGFKSQHMFDGNGNSSCEAGLSILRWVNIPRRGSVGTCDGYAVPLGGRKDGRQIYLDTTATHGILTFGPPIQTTVTITEGPNGQTSVNVWGTPYPSTEIWQYGGPNGPKLIYHQGANGSPLDLYSPRRVP